MGRLVTFDIDRFKKEVDEDMKQAQEKILEGGCNSFEEYRHWCGVLRGQGKVLDRLETAMKTEDDDGG